MFHPHFALAIAVVCVLSACSTIPDDPAVARQKAYERLASFLEPGMTRRQLYALLPPQRPPMTTFRNPSLFTFTMVGTDSLQAETYPLDRDFSLETEYILAASPLGKFHSLPAPLTTSPAARSGPLAISAHAVDICYSATPPAGSSHVKATVATRAATSISAAAIDELLFGKGGRPRRSKQDLDDRLYARPRVVRDQR